MLTLPQLPGITFPVDVDFGNFDTTVEAAASGIERRYANRVQTQYRRTLEIDGLDSGGKFTGLTAASLQTLAGFFMQCYGQALMFQFWAPEDNAASTQPFGIGDGSTTAFQLTRSFGGWADKVLAPVLPSGAPVQIPSPTNPNGAIVFAPNNFLLNTATLSTQSVTLPAGNFVLSFDGTGHVVLSGAASGTLTGTGVSNRVSMPFTSAGGSVTATVTGTVTLAQLEQSTITTPGPYFATAASPYYGGPYITAGGTLVDPSAYSVSAPGGASAGGIVTFNSAPAASAALVWTGNYYWLANWDEDKIALSEFMSGLWSAKKLSFTTRIF